MLEAKGSEIQGPTMATQDSASEKNEIIKLIDSCCTQVTPHQSYMKFFKKQQGTMTVFRPSASEVGPDTMVQCSSQS